MNVVELLNAVSGLFGALAWPMLVLCIVLVFRKQIARFLGGVEEVSVTTPIGFEASAKIRLESAVAAATAVKSTATWGSPSTVLAEAELAANRVESTLRHVGGQAFIRSRILWVDDRPENNIFERAALESIGAHVTLSIDTDDAVERIAQQPFDVVITDMSRPSGNTAGYVLLDQVKTLASSSVPVIIYAGSASPDQVEAARQRGAFGCTNRPGELVLLVVEAIKTRRAAA